MSQAAKKYPVHPVPDQNLAGKKHIHLFIAGIGAVGGTLLKLVDELVHPRFNLSVIGICNSKHSVWNNDGLQAESLKKELCCGEPTRWDELPAQLVSRKKTHTVFIDATGSEEVARTYSWLLEHGIHVATPSKRANTFEQEYFDKLKGITAEGEAHYKYETTVGAGLPVINTIENLLDSGDQITKITGVVSGTMTYLFNELEKGIPFSKAVKTAREKGYSEPDPRDDLSGEDVARKFLILARTCGYRHEREDLSVESLVPGKLHAGSAEEFLEKFEDCDAYWLERYQDAQAKQQTLRYTGTFTPEEIEVGVKEVPDDSPLGSLTGTDNLIQIFSRRYGQSPIVIQGPGAGKDVTAAGVLSNVIEIANRVVK